MAINPSEITVADKNRAMYILQNGGNRGDYLVAVLAILTAHIPPTDKMQRSVPCGCKDMTIDDWLVDRNSNGGRIPHYIGRIS